MRVNAVRIATAVSGSEIDVASDVAVTFEGNGVLVIPAGGDVWSDLVPFAVPDLGNLGMTFYIERSTPVQTFHRIAMQEAFVAKGEHLYAARMPENDTHTHGSWYWLSELAVSCDSAKDVIVTIGDSNTEGDQRPARTGATRISWRGSFQTVPIL